MFLTIELRGEKKGNQMRSGLRKRWHTKFEAKVFMRTV